MSNEEKIRQLCARVLAASEESEDSEEFQTAMAELKAAIRDLVLAPRVN